MHIRILARRASERRILRERRERLARREEVRARVRGWPLARVPARASEREHVDARGEPGRSLLRTRVWVRARESVFVSSARAEGPVALAEEPEARA